FGRIQQFEQFDRIARSLVIKGVSSLLLLAIGLWLTHDALGAAAGIAVGFLLTLLFCDIPNSRFVAHLASQSSPPAASSESSLASAPQLWAFLKQAAPLAFASSLIILNPNIVIYALRIAFGKDSTPLIGTFGAFNYLPQIGMNVVAAVAV